MTHRVGVVADRTVSLGFRLAGLRPYEADSAEAASSLLDRMTAEGKWGVILVQEDLVPETVAGVGQRPASDLPIVIPFPGPSGVRVPGEAEAYVAELLRQAVGYRVRLR